jgi:hypothetical protein
VKSVIPLKPVKPLKYLKSVKTLKPVKPEYTHHIQMYLLAVDRQRGFDESHLAQLNLYMFRF